MYPPSVQTCFASLLLLACMVALPLRAEADLVIVTDANGRANIAATEVFLAATVGMAAFPSPSNNRELLAGATEGGSGCPYQDIGCWRRLAKLSGAPGAWVLVPSADGSTSKLFRGDDSGDKATDMLRNDAEGWRHAVQRLLGQQAAMIVTCTPDNAQMTLDGVPLLSGITEGLSLGQHILVAAAPGFASTELAIELVGGDIGNVQVNLSASSSTSNPTLFWAGAIMTGIGVVGQPLWLAQWGHNPITKKSEDAWLDARTAALMIIPAGIASVVGITGLVLMFVSGGPE